MVEHEGFKKVQKGSVKQRWREAHRCKEESKFSSMIMDILLTVEILLFLLFALNISFFSVTVFQNLKASSWNLFYGHVRFVDFRPMDGLAWFSFLRARK